MPYSHLLINFADELWSAIKGEVLAHPPSPFEQKMKNQSNSDFQNQKTMAFGFSKKGNQLNYEPKAEINSDFQTALTCSSSNILLINLISKQESQDDENYFLVT